MLILYEVVFCLVRNPLLFLLTAEPSMHTITRTNDVNSHKQRCVPLVVCLFWTYAMHWVTSSVNLAFANMVSSVDSLRIVSCETGACCFVLNCTVRPPLFFMGVMHKSVPANVDICPSGRIVGRTPYRRAGCVLELSRRRKLEQGSSGGPLLTSRVERRAENVQQSAFANVAVA